MTSGKTTLPLPPDTRSAAEWAAEEFATLAEVAGETRFAQAQGIHVTGWAGASADAYQASSAELGECVSLTSDALRQASDALDTWREHLHRAILAVPELQERFDQAEAAYRAGFQQLEQAVTQAAASSQVIAPDAVQSHANALLAQRDQVQAEVLTDYTRAMKALDDAAHEAAAEIKASGNHMMQNTMAAGLLINAGCALLPGKWEDEDARKGRYGPDQSSVPAPTGGSEAGLGQPVPGTKAPIPRPKPWVYPGDTEKEGSGTYKQRDSTIMDHAVHEAATLGAGLLGNFWPDASHNLNHYLGNSGHPRDVDVDGMLQDVPGMKNRAHKDVEVQAREAVAAAKQSGGSEPVTYPFTTEWKHYYVDKSESENWFYATGGCHYATAGTVTVYPPSSPGGEWTYDYDYQTHMADRYNWDGQKSTRIGPLTITDKQLQELHKAGLAKEYDLRGESSVQHGSGP